MRGRIPPRKGPGKPRTRSHYGTPRRQRKRASRRIAENSAETDKVTKGEQDATKGLTIQVNNTVTTQAETLKRLDGQERKMASPKESQNTSHPEPLETAGTLSIWSLGLMGATICLIATIDFVMISSPLDSQEILHARINERQYPTRHQQNQASRNWTELHTRDDGEGSPTQSKTKSIGTNNLHN